MLTSMEITDIVAKVENGELTKEKLLEGIASAQYGEDMRKYIYAILLYWIGGGTFRHDELENRNKPDQHSIKAISDLEDILARMQSLSAVDAVTVPEKDDFDEYFTEGNYKVATVSTAETIKNIPHPVGGRLIVLSTNLVGRYFQIYLANTPNANIYVRFYNGSSWNEWVSLASKKDVESVEKKAITSGETLITTSNYTDYFTSFDDIPVNTVYNIGYGVPLENAPPSNILFNQPEDERDYPAGTVITWSGKSSGNDRGRVQLFFTHATGINQSIFCFRTGYTQSNVVYYAPWQRLSEVSALTSSNIVIRAETAYKYFTDLNDAPNNSIYQIDLNCTDGILENHPFPGVSSVLITFGFSFISLHGRVQMMFAIPDGEVALAFRYGYKQSSGDMWTRWQKAVTEPMDI